jgi:hypothetical protein
MTMRHVGWSIGLVLCGGGFLNAPAAPPSAVGPYDGPLIDAVVQWTYQSDLGKTMTIEDMARHLRAAHVDEAGVMVACRSQMDKPACGDEDKALVRRRMGLLSKHPECGPKGILFQGSPNYFLTAANMDPKSVDLFIEEAARRPYAFVGEILYRHADKSSGDVTPEGERHIDPLSPDSVNLITRIAGLRRSIPIFIHWEFYRWDEDRPRFAEFFKRFPEQIFIINHMGFGSPQEVEDILKNHDNVFFTISKRLHPFKDFADPRTKQGSSILGEHMKIRAEWKELFLAYPTRFLFATDSHKPFMWDNYERKVWEYRLLLSQLPDDVAQRIAHRNAETVFRLKSDAKGKGSPVGK